jgi:DNA-binding CsgD family transcriptional regulator/tetratricopeptide (TPR) repeat protein
MVGRAAELGQLRALLREAAAGRPVVALVSGDAGVGKTRLVSELSAAARADGYAVLTGRCAELADTVPYLPLADALRDATVGASASGPVRDALAARPALSRLLPDVGPARPPGGDMPGLAQQQLFGAVLGMLAELAEASPVLLVLEDLHWADQSTRDLVTFLSRALHRERLAIVVTYRTDDMHRRHPLRPVVAELSRLPNVTTVALGPLDPSAMAEHLNSLTDQRPDTATLDSLITRAEGNAYYAEELLAASCAGGELPPRLADLLLARTERLSPAAQQVLRTAAVTGRRIDDELARQASGLAAPEYEDAVREAVAHQLLVPDGDRGYAFRHALLREAIYADLLPGERTRLHGRLAELLADQLRRAEMPGIAAELAHHSLASHDIPGAFAASVAAGQEADRLAAPAEAHRHYNQALALWERVPDPEALSGMGRGKLAFRSANSAADSGDLGRAVQTLRRLLGFLDRSDDPVLFCRASERLAYFLLDLDEYDSAIAAAETAVEALPEEPALWQRARALGTYARALLSMKDEAPARSQAELAIKAARAAQAPWVEADALVTLGQLSEAAGRIEEAIDLSTRAHQQARAAAVIGVELRAAFQLARVQLESGDLDAASTTAHDGVLRAEQAGLGLAPYGYDLQYLHYLAHYAAGEWEHAQELADGFGIRVSGASEARLSAMALFVEVARDSPAVADRLTWLEPFFGRDRFAEYIARGLLAEHAFWHGDGDTALAQVEATIRAYEAAHGASGPTVIRPAAVGVAVLADRARQARLAGDAAGAQAAVDEAHTLLEVAREGAAFPLRPNSVLGLEGSGWLARAEAEWRRAQGDNDPAAWQAVVDAFGPAFVYETARSRWRLAEALTEAGRREEAQAELLLAAQAADRLGAKPLRTAPADLSRRARLADRSAPAGAGHGPGGAATRDPLAGLTAREAEVLRLIAAGQSNKEIAAELFIAPKTASVHVSNILAKLGAASRTEAAAIAHAQGLGPPAQPKR